MAKASSRNSDMESGRQSSSSMAHSSSMDESTTVESSNNDPKRKRMICWYSLAATSVLLLVAVVAVAVVLFILPKTKDGPLTLRQQEISDMVATLVADPEALKRSSSPQAKAQHWLTRKDTIWANDNSTVITKEMVAQRLALAVFYYATNGPSSWKDEMSNNWLNGPECEWTGIVCHQSSSHVHTILLEQAGLDGSIPEEIGLLSHLQSLVLKDHANLGGRLPGAALAQLVHLQQVFVTHSALTGSLPTELYALDSLQYINFESNALTGTIASDIVNLSQLKALAVTDNRLTGTIPYTAISALNMEFLSLSSNAFFGKMTDAIRDWTSMRYLYLDHNVDLDGTLPIALGGATQLQSLRIDSTSMAGRIPAVIGRLPQLQRLSFANCQLTGSFPGEINRLTQLTSLNLASNALTGELPRLDALANVTSLSLAHNQLRGTVGEAFANLSSLELLFLNDNALSGAIPTMIGQKNSESSSSSSSFLRGLYLSHNNCSGSISESICNLTRLETFTVDDNPLLASPFPSCLLSTVEWPYS